MNTTNETDGTTPTTDLDIKSLAKKMRVEVKSMAASVKGLMRNTGPILPVTDVGEVKANIMLTYRLLEDASMRLGKVIQAYDGGESVYDKREVVGAP